MTRSLIAAEELVETAEVTLADVDDASLEVTSMVTKTVEVIVERVVTLSPSEFVVVTVVITPSVSSERVWELEEII